MVIDLLDLLLWKLESSFVDEYSLIGILERVVSLTSFDCWKSTSMTEMSSFEYFSLSLYLWMS